MAAALGTMGDIRPAAMILGYPCITKDICNELRVLYNNDCVPTIDDKVDDKTPPAFIFADSNDGLVPIGSSIDFASALKKQNIPYELHVYNDGGHGFSTSDYVTCRGVYEYSSHDWLNKCKLWLYKLFFN